MGRLEARGQASLPKRLDGRRRPERQPQALKGLWSRLGLCLAVSIGQSHPSLGQITHVSRDAPFQAEESLMEHREMVRVAMGDEVLPETFGLGGLR